MNFDRGEDLESVAKKRLDANFGANKVVQNMKKHDDEFNQRMFGVYNKDSIRREMREANTPSARVNNLKQKMDNANTFNRNFFGDK